MPETSAPSAFRCALPELPDRMKLTVDSSEFAARLEIQLPSLELDLPTVRDPIAHQPHQCRREDRDHQTNPEVTPGVALPVVHHLRLALGCRATIRAVTLATVTGRKVPAQHPRECVIPPRAGHLTAGTAWTDPLPSTDADRGGDPNGHHENDEEKARWVSCTST